MEDRQEKSNRFGGGGACQLTGKRSDELAHISADEGGKMMDKKSVFIFKGRGVALLQEFDISPD